ncbi:hypothetical protein GCM10018987_38930 [Streptomyces cremeus]
MGREHPLRGPSFGTSAEQGRRVAAFCRAYGPDLAGPEVLDVLPDRLQALIDFTREQAAQGHEAFRRHLAEGHADLYAGDEVRRSGPGPRGTGPGPVLRTREGRLPGRNAPSWRPSAEEERAVR